MEALKIKVYIVLPVHFLVSVDLLKANLYILIIASWERFQVLHVVLSFS